MTAGKLDRRITIETPAASSTDAYGNPSPAGWSSLGTRWAELRYIRGSEAVQTGGLAGKASYKVRLRHDGVTRAITTACRVTHAGRAYNVREVDTITDRAWVWLTIESGVAI